MSQIDSIHSALAEGRTISGAQAESWWGVGRLPARIFDLREEGFQIMTERYTRRDGTLAGRYRLYANSRRTRPTT